MHAIAFASTASIPINFFTEPECGQSVSQGNTTLAVNAFTFLFRYQTVFVRLSSRESGFFTVISDRVAAFLASPPPHSMRALQERFSSKSKRIFDSIRMNARPALRFVDGDTFRKVVAPLRYRAVAGLVGANLGAFMLLNSRYMKTKSRVDNLPRVDRHFIASRYNVVSGRIWCIPLSLFNHSDSMFRLGMNCLGLCLVGPAVELAFGPSVVIGGFLLMGSASAIAETLIGNHWCRGSSAGVTGLLGMGAFAAPNQIVSLWGVWDVRALSVAVSVFLIEGLLGMFGSPRTETAHIAHAVGILTSIPLLYYLRWFR